MINPIANMFNAFLIIVEHLPVAVLLEDPH